MSNSFEQLKLIVSELSLDKKHSLVKLLNSQVSGQSCLDILTGYQDSASTCPLCHSQSIKLNEKINNRQRSPCQACSKSLCLHSIHLFIS
jgi:hypothetical protein